MNGYFIRRDCDTGVSMLGIAHWNLFFMNIRECTQRAESPGFNSVGQRPTKGNVTYSQALQGRNQRDYALAGQIANNFRHAGVRHWHSHRKNLVDWL